MSLPAGPNAPRVQEMEIPKNFRDFTVTPGKGLFLKSSDGSHLFMIAVRNGAIILRNNETGQEVPLTPGERYVMGRHDLKAYSIDAQHQMQLNNQNVLPADFFAAGVERTVSRKGHFHILVHGFDHDGNIGVSIKDVSKYAPVQSTERYETSAEIQDIPVEAQSPAAQSLPKLKICLPLPHLQHRALNTPRRAIGTTPLNLSLSDGQEIILETNGHNHIARLSTTPQGLLITNDLSDEQRSLPAGHIYALDPETLGDDFFGANSVLMAKNQCAVQVAGRDTQSGVVSFKLVAPNVAGTPGVFAKFEIAEFADEAERSILPKNSSATFTLEEGQPVTLETLRGSHLFCAYLLKGALFLHNLLTDEVVLLQPGENLPLGTASAKCTKNLLGDSAKDLGKMHGGIIFDKLEGGAATLRVINGSARNGLQYASGALRPGDVFPYKERVAIKPDNPRTVKFLGTDNLALIVPVGIANEELFARIQGSSSGQIVLVSRAGGRIVLDEGENLIGRKKQMPEFFGKVAPYVSATHLQVNVKRIDQGRFEVVLADLNSSNGTQAILYPGSDLNG